MPRALREGRRDTGSWTGIAPETDPYMLDAGDAAVDVVGVLAAGVADEPLAEGAVDIGDGATCGYALTPALHVLV